jgi:hypothetical protein
MAFTFAAQKVLRAEVTAGVDLESGVLLTGERITIGTGSNDTLRLGARNVVPGHLTFHRQRGSAAWEYMTSDRGQTAVDAGNARTGPVRAGMSFVLGGETRIELRRVPAPPDLAKTETSTGGTTVPLPIALAAMAAMTVAFALYLGGLGGDRADGSALRTTQWFDGTASVEDALAACLASGLGPEARGLASRTGAAEPDALFRASLPGTPDAAAARAALAAQVRGLIAESHLLLRENRALDASRTLRRMENVLPVGTGDCPILSAARLDLAILELEGGRP